MGANLSITTESLTEKREVGHQYMGQETGSFMLWKMVPLRSLQLPYSSLDFCTKGAFLSTKSSIHMTFGIAELWNEDYMICVHVSHGKPQGALTIKAMDYSRC